MAYINSFDPTTKIRNQEVFCDNKYYKINKTDYTPQLIRQVDLYNDMYIHELSPNKSFDAIIFPIHIKLLLENMINIAGKALSDISNITTAYGSELTLKGNQSCPGEYLFTHIASTAVNNTCIKTCFSGEIVSDTPIIS